MPSEPRYSSIPRLCYLKLAISLAQQALDVARSDEVEDIWLEIVQQLAKFLSVTDSQGRSVKDLEAAILRGKSRRIQKRHRDSKEPTHNPKRVEHHQLPTEVWT